jgi:hypothetical protein
MVSKPYKSPICGHKTLENREIPSKGREITREKTGKNTPKGATRKIKIEKGATLSRKSI